ncbi:MAG TPA: sulfate ABC transporter ATP-binding protein [Cyanobacteria bacterium UBA11149]|nr:sulfate ABC transporter ATP-binding protein [Cyanobacteria bacterium UBA11367]HBE60339.1 sulfate ABC transporter ATP-binding protein [Cyanobacteria bacterium UBA11366]HBK66649.1 sulfate ABC transporter ATP-binding protein [Cyanobacteria bacterium UBA11166]HBR75419.1 sulfate ABC transporter ATP-binding protein [Cyanobacteria bacterium UBA11159]HBS71863.1 sulfate ABC transporter ATP-binding protein [Cyanobacteria bacterium UBA11153]HBW89683.1 sulfate ABC transporter ATP-binding protein [Cyano
MSIIVNNISKDFGNFKALDKVSLTVKEGSLVALLGPSGSGKSTLLRAIAGLEEPDSGSIIINGEDTTHLDVSKRNIGFVFQHYALFKHMTIRQNIAFGLDIRKRNRKFVKERVEELLELIQLQGLGDRYPSQLSGGQRQRVALARALAVQPQVLLLDEPFGALDAKVRKELRAWLRRLHEDVHVTSIFVTHDQEEAMEVADEIVVMNQGRIEQVGTPAQIYDRPATPFVMSFIGPVNVLPSHTLLCRDNGLQPSHSEIFVRPHDIHIQTSPNGVSAGAVVKRVIHLGWEIQVELALPDNEVVVANLSRQQFSELELEAGQRVFIKPKDVKSFAGVAGTNYQAA